MEVDYEYIEEMYNAVRLAIVIYIVNTYQITTYTVVGIVDYENTEITEDCEVAYNQVKDLMEQDLIKGKSFNIQLMADKIMTNDEGKYQLSLKNEQ